MAFSEDLYFSEKSEKCRVMNSGLSAEGLDIPKKGEENILDHTHGSQSTLMAPQVELPQSWMNFSIEKTPGRSSTDLPYSAWRPLSWLSAAGSLETQPMWATPMTLLFKLASRTPVQQ
jgi:hypothetical protein